MWLLAVPTQGRAVRKITSEVDPMGPKRSMIGSIGGSIASASRSMIRCLYLRSAACQISAVWPTPGGATQLRAPQRCCKSARILRAPLVRAE